jgi:ATP-dependent helicase/nuclease subunit B
MTIFTAHWHQDILTLTAQEMLRRYDAATLPQALILMPNRRSCIAMREAFSRVHEGKTILLPRIVPLGDAETELLMACARGQSDVESLLETLPPAMSHWQQRILLAELVRAFESKRTGVEPSLHHVLALTDDLIEIQQHLIREHVDVSKIDIRDVAFSDMAQHWQLNATFLNILFKEWKYIEGEKGLTTLAAREQMLLHAIHTAWHKAPPPHPVWIVGSTGSMPAVRTLMATIQGMLDGYIVLPGLDISTANAVNIGHPQYYLQLSLKAMGVATQDVRILGADAMNARQAMWLGHAIDISGIESITCAHEEEEAGIISLMVREALETESKMTAIVTPNIMMMQRIRLSLKRYGIHVNTPQGEPLVNQPAGRLWSYLLRCLSEEVGVVSLLDVLHAEGVNCGEDEQVWNDFLYHWRQKCRGVLGRAPASQRLRKLASNYPVANALARTVHDLEGLYAQHFTLAQWLEHIKAIVQALALQPIAGAEAVHEAIIELSAASTDWQLDVDDMVAVVQEALMKPVRMPDMSAHPRVYVLSPMEARLQQFDRVVLAGFNENDWPQVYQPSPWLNLAQRAKLGLTPPEAQATLTAHDIHMLGMVPEFFMTRSLKSEGSPTTASRYLVKLETELERAGLQLSSRSWREWWEALRKTEAAPLRPEAPQPPVAARPRTLRVTSLRNLFSDPYAIYAEYVLGLRELEPFDKTPDAATFGSLVHTVIEDMLTQEKSADDAEWLLAHVTHLESDPRLYALWLPRIRTILRFVAAVHAQRKYTAIEMEAKKEVHIGEVTLVGKIDRLEKQGAKYSIHDYKTGDAPTKTAMGLGLEPQLIAYALMLSQETGIVPEQLVYWALPKARHQGALIDYEFGESNLEQHIVALRSAISQMFADDYAFYALDNDGTYTGVSRNDEWVA